MGTRNSISNIPEFLIKTAFGCSLVVIAILTTFTVSHFVQGRYTLRFAVLAVIAGCSVNVWHGFQRRYSAATNTYLLFPICVLTFSYAMFELRSAASYPPLLLVLGCYFVLPEKRALVFNILAALMIIPSAWLVLDPPSAIRFSATFVGVSLFAYIAIHEINNLHGSWKTEF